MSPHRRFRFRVVRVDGIDLVAIAGLAQTIVLAVTMVVFILQFRSQEKATKEAAYQKVMDDYNDVVRTLLGRPELGVLMDDLVKSSPVSAQRRRQLSADERLVWSYLMMVYALLERVYLLYEKKWIDENTWREWETWLALMAKHPMFSEVHSGTKGMFNRSFQDHVSRLVEPSSTGTAERAREPAGP